MPEVPEVRNARYINEESTLIDCEVNHPQFGWIPYTASETDIEPYSWEVFAAAVTVGIMPYIPPEPPTPEEVRAAMPALSRRQLLLGLYSISITEAQVDAAIGSDTQGMIEWRNAGSYKRTHPLVSNLAVHFSLTDEEIDSLWLWASEL